MSSKSQMKHRIVRFLPIQSLILVVLSTISVHAQWEVVPTYPPYKLRKIQFIGDRGWLSAEFYQSWDDRWTGVFLRTDDGGDSWVAYEGLHFIMDFHFIKSEEGWYTDGHELFHTRDGGEIWNQVPSEVDYTEVSQSQYIGPGCPSRIHFFDSNHGIGISQWTSDVFFNTKVVVVSVTKDGGKHWSVRQWERDAPEVYSWEIVGDHIWIPRNSGVWFSPDRGQSWDLLAAPTGRGSARTTLEFLETNEGWAVSYESVVYHTEDGGKTWRRISSTSKTAQDMLFISESEGWILTLASYLDWHRAALWQTQDGGKSWKLTPWPVESTTILLYPRGLPASMGQLAFNQARGELWVSLYKFNYPLLHDRKVNVTSINPFGRLQTTWGNLKSGQ